MMIRKLAGLALGMALLVGCDGPQGDAPVAVGEPVPAYAAPTLAGDTVALGDLRGEAVLLNVWATWCPPCREEMPGLQALHEQFAGEGLRVVGVSIDAENAEDEIRRFLRENGITFTILHDPRERVSRTFRTTGVPETFLIDRDGVLIARWIGAFDPLSEDARSKVRAALDTPRSSRE
jgi:peroxiredoxin